MTTLEALQRRHVPSRDRSSLNPGVIRGFDPQPEPPGSTRGFDPKPEPPAKLPSGVAVSR